MLRGGLFLAFAAVSILGPARITAGTDSTCLYNCQVYQRMDPTLCERICQVPDKAPPAFYTPPPQTDFACLNDCQTRGYAYQYCKKACSY